MKKSNTTVLRTILFAVVATLALSNISAGGGIQVKTVKDKSIVVVMIQELNQQSVKLSIEDAREQTIYYKEKMSNTNSVYKTFDLSSLRNGDYVIIAETGSRTLKEMITVLDSKISVKEVTEVNINKPVFKLQDNMLTVYFDNQLGEECSVHFTNEQDVFFSDVTNDLLVARKYNLSQLLYGEYTVSVNSGDKSYQYALSIQ